VPVAELLRPVKLVLAQLEQGEIHWFGLVALLSALGYLVVLVGMLSLMVSQISLVDFARVELRQFEVSASSTLLQSSHLYPKAVRMRVP
jgi:hypothetical protein